MSPDDPNADKNTTAKTKAGRMLYPAALDRSTDFPAKYPMKSAPRRAAEAANRAADSWMSMAI